MGIRHPYFPIPPPHFFNSPPSVLFFFPRSAMLARREKELGRF